jgi:hypothetical protein
LIAFVSRFESFFICGSFTWLYYNRTNILENQTLLLARVRFIRAPQAAFWCGFSKNLGAACSVAQWKLSLIQLESPSFPSMQSDCRCRGLQHDTAADSVLSNHEGVGGHAAYRICT